MLGVKGPNWTEKHVSDTVLVGPANMGSLALPPSCPPLLLGRKKKKMFPLS